MAKKGTKRASEPLHNGAKKARVSVDLSQSESEASDEMDEVSADESQESEDELDNLDSDNQKDDAASDDSDNSDNSDDDEEAEAAGEVDPNKKSSKEQHAEQRKLLAERKLKRKSGIEVQQIKSLWERLRVNKPTPPKEVRDKLSDEIWSLSKDVVSDLVMKHDASRVVQTLVKYSSKERRDQIVNEMKGSYYQLATSSYGKYLLIKLLHYGSKESRALIVNELHGKLRKLMRHREGAYVVEDLFVLYSTGEQKQQMIREFWGAEYAVFKESGKGKTVLDIVNESTEKRQLIMANLSGTITASVEKGSTGFQILHAAMKEYVTILTSDIDAYDSQIREFEELLGEQIAELVHTPEGAEVASSLIAMANAKERKTIVKSLKSHGADLIKNEHGNLVLITLFMTVDDTVLLHKSFSTELFTADKIADIIQGKFSRRPVVYLLKGLDARYFNPLIKGELTKYEALAYKKTTKKPQEQRREELVSRALPVIYESILSIAESNSPVTFEELLSSNLAAQTITELILTPTSVKEVNEDLRQKLIDAVFERAVQGDVLEDFHLLNKVPFISRSIKSLIHGDEFKWDPQAKKLVFQKPEDKIPGVGKEFAQRVLDEILSKDKLQDWVSGQGSFIVVAIYEVFQASKDDGKLKQLKKELKGIKKVLSSDKDNKGAQILLKLFN